ncbi:hypothetical protein PMIN06_002263 [Paraphaeosphaeria minitans]
MLEPNSKQHIAGNGKHPYTIYVGKASIEPFSVDKDLETLLRAASPFFAAKFDEQKRVIKLPTFSPEDFRAYRDWLHSRRRSPRHQAELPEGKTNWYHIYQAFLFGEHLQDYSYCNTTTNMLLAAAYTATTKQSVKELLACTENVFISTAENSPIRKLLFDVVKWQASSVLSRAELAAQLRTIPDFSAEWSAYMCECGSMTASPWSNTCKYHRHIDGDSCYASTEDSLRSSFQKMLHDWTGFMNTAVHTSFQAIGVCRQAVTASFQAFRPCVLSTYTVLQKLGSECKVAFSWCRAFVKTHL